MSNTRSKKILSLQSLSNYQLNNNIDISVVNSKYTFDVQSKDVKSYGCSIRLNPFMYYNIYIYIGNYDNTFLPLIY